MTPIPSPIGPGSFPGGPEGANFPNEAMLRRMMEQRMAQNQGVMGLELLELKSMLWSKSVDRVRVKGRIKE
jgi:hypothetical protein